MAAWTSQNSLDCHWLGSKPETVHHRQLSFSRKANDGIDNTCPLQKGCDANIQCRPDQPLALAMTQKQHHGIMNLSAREFMCLGFGYQTLTKVCRVADVWNMFSDFGHVPWIPRLHARNPKPLLLSQRVHVSTS